MKAAALRLLALRPHTREELRRKLRLRGFDAGEVGGLLDRLTEVGYLDDAAAARSWVRYRLEGRPMGRRMMEAELERRGVAPAVGGPVLDAAYEEQPEEDLALRAGGKRLRSLGPPGAPRTRERLLRFLQGRGFPPPVCFRAAGALLGGAAPGEGAGAGAEEYPAEEGMEEDREAR